MILLGWDAFPKLLLRVQTLSYVALKWFLRFLAFDLCLHEEVGKSSNFFWVVPISSVNNHFFINRAAISDIFTLFENEQIFFIHENFDVCMKKTPKRDKGAPCAWRGRDVQLFS